MKVKKIKFNNHKIFNDLEIDFKNKDEEILDTVIIIGVNGVGKTTLLKEIFKTLSFKKSALKELSSSENFIEITCDSTTIELMGNHKEIIIIKNMWEDKEDVESNKETKLVYMPAEINFEKVNKVDNTFNFTPAFQSVIDQNMTQNIPSFIATKINKEIFRNRDKTIGEVIDKVCNQINSVFSIMDLDIKLVGLSEDNDTRPIFRNSLGKEFDITGLSSGEKQLFLRALSLKFLDVNNSVILIDEPEISLHPQWQKKIIDMYINIGVNNQIIIATHSPHVIGSVTSDKLRVMTKDNNEIIVVDNANLTETYGKSIGDILSTTMELDSLRNEDITNKLNKAYELLNKNLYNTDEFKLLFEYLRRYLGDLDKDIMRIRLDISIRNRNNVKCK